MSLDASLLLPLDLLGVFAFALNGALVAIKAARIDIIGVLTLGIVTALGGGIVRDLLIGDVPPTTFNDWRYLAVAGLGSMIAFVLGARLDRLSGSINVLDAMGLGLFAVTGALKALEHGLGPVQAVILGGLTAVGGGTIRDMMLQRVPVVLREELYAIPALFAALATVIGFEMGVGAPVAIGAAVACFLARLVAVQFDLHAPKPWGHREHREYRRRGAARDN